MSDIQREESFRSAIKNQKRRLSATKVEKRNSLTPDAGFPNPPARAIPLVLKQRRDSMTPPRRDGATPPRFRDTPPTSNRSTPARTTEPISIHKSEQDGSQPDIRLEFWNIEELSPLSTPATSPRPSPRNSPSPTPVVIARTPSRSPSPRPLNSPVPPGSPLLSPHTISPALKRARSFNKDLRRAANFRAQRDRSCSRNSSRVSSRCVSPEPEPEPVVVNNIPQEVSFTIKRTLGTRKGWKIMPEEGGEVEGAALKKVVNMIKDIEFQGFAVPERITIKMP